MTSRLVPLLLASSVACSDASLPTQPGRSPAPGPAPPGPAAPGPAAPNPEPSPYITFAGVISESGTGLPLSDVRVCWPLSNCARTGADGSYELTALSPVDPRATLTLIYPFAWRDGFEIRSAEIAVKGERIPWSPTLQRTITVEAGQIFRSTIFSGEGSGLADEGGCEPCKSLHVSLPGRSGTLVVRLAPESAASGLEVEVPSLGFRREDGSLPVTTERNVQVIVKAPRAPVTFELSTMFTPAS